MKCSVPNIIQRHIRIGDGAVVVIFSGGPNILVTRFVNSTTSPFHLTGLNSIGLVFLATGDKLLKVFLLLFTQFLKFNDLGAGE